MMDPVDVPSSWQEPIATFTRFISSSHPPSTIIIHNPTSSKLLPTLLNDILVQSTTSSPSSDREPTVQDLLPKVARFEANEVHSTRAFFEQITNELSGWNLSRENALLSGNDETAGIAGASVGRVENWDGRTEGCEVVPMTPQMRGRKRRRAGEDEYEEKQLVLAEKKYTLRWSPDSPLAASDPLAPLPNSISSLYSSLSTISSLSSDEESKPRRRFLLINRAEMLNELPSKGSTGGAPKETAFGMTFLATIVRAEEFAQTPLTSILISSLPYHKLRENLVGVPTNPMTITFPELSREDTVSLLLTRFLSSDPPPEPLSVPPPLNDDMSVDSDLLTDEEKLATLFKAFAGLIYDAFSTTFGRGDLVELSFYTVKFWEAARSLVEDPKTRVSVKDSARLTSNLKPSIISEIRQLGLPKPSFHPVAEVANKALVANVATGFSGTVVALSNKDELASKYRTDDPFLSPLPLTTTSTSTAVDVSLVSASANNTATKNYSLTKSLPEIAKWILVAAYYAAFNPSSKDVQMFASTEDGCGLGRRGKKKGGGTKLSPAKSKAISNDLSGGKTFPLERMLAIFEAVSNQQGAPFDALTVDVGMQINTLISLRLLGRVSAQDKALEGVKLKSCLNKETVDSLAKSIGFKKWKDYIWDETL